jgi:CheY-like chemotaxis protein
MEPGCLFENVLCHPNKSYAGHKRGSVMKPNSTVLLVENNPDDARLAELAFERAKLQHLLMVVPDAFEAGKYLTGKGRYTDRQRFPFPKLILLDLGLPGMSGFDFLVELRRDPHLKAVPVTVLSGSDYLRDVTKAYQLGANSFLLKPTQLGKFADALKETTEFWLDGKRHAISSVYLQTPARATQMVYAGNPKSEL